ELTPISGSLPISMAKSRPSLSVFGRKVEMVSKSWSDLWDEEIEEEEEHERNLRERQTQNARTWSHESTADDTGIRRDGLSEPKSSSFVNIKSSFTPEAGTTTANDIDNDIVNDGFFFHDSTPKR